MIAVIQGEVLEATPLSVVVDAGGVGYELNIPVSTAGKVPPVGGHVKLFVHDIYREDDQTLYGFSTREERDFFRMLVEKVSGVGPRIALALLSKLSLPMIANAIAAGDSALIAHTPGIGRKTAERLVVELRDKVSAIGVTTPTNTTAIAGNITDEAANPVCDAINALVTLGYNVQAADKAVQRAVKKLGSDAQTDAILKAALASE